MRHVKWLIVLGLVASGLSNGHLQAEGQAGTELLSDPAFEGLEGKTLSREAVTNSWSIPSGAPYADSIVVKAEKAAARNGKVGLKLQRMANGRIASVHQVIPQLSAGVYDFKVWAKGEGVLVLRTGNLTRRGDLTKEWAEYTLTFEQAAAGPADLAMATDANAQLDDTSLAPASAERQAAWQAQEKARNEYGFLPEYYSTQLSQPGAPVKSAGKFQGGPVTWREKVVFYDDHYDSAWSTHPEILAQYLGANGFRVLRAAPFGEWMKKTTQEGAYGTVCVMTHGVCPRSVYDDKVMESPIRKYIEAGGRVVWIGDVPFYYLQDDTHPQIFGKGGPGEILGVRAGWDYGCWANQGEPKISSLGKAWGLDNAGGSVIAAYPEDITAALSGFHSDYADSDLTVYWFKNFNALCPWSGFIMASRASDMANTALQQSVYRLALYTGQPVEAPVGISVAAKESAVSPLNIVLDPPRNRQCYYRGEKIPVQLKGGTAVVPGEGQLRLAVERDGEQWMRGECARPGKEEPVQAAVQTADLACGDYRLKVLATEGGKETTLCEAAVSVCPRHEDPIFFYGVSGGGGANPYRQDLLMKDLVSMGMHMGTATPDTPPRLMDVAIKHGLRFALRAHGSANLSDKEREEAERRGPNGEKIPGAWEGGRPIQGLLHPKVRQLRAEDMAKQVKEICAWPGCWPRCQTCDDFSIYYGWDFSDLAKRTFKEKTGIDAPILPQLAKLGERFQDCGAIDRPKGVVPENDPWLQWSIFCTRDIGGAYNKALTDACVKAVPEIKVGPVPGGMQLPLWTQGQYPPHHFGANGFNLLNYYYYLYYWQPQIGNLYWNEIARMANRDMELWALPDCLSDEPTYTRNTFFLQMAGGCQGLNYYSYNEMVPVAKKELGQLGREVVQPLYPFLGRLRPVQTEAGLLLPYTQYAHTWLYGVSAIYPYANLLGAHLDIQPTCEEEAMSGYIRNYKAILLWKVEWMREAAVKALEDYIAKGGVVLADSTTTVPIKGAVKLSVDLAMGDKQSKPDVNDPRFGGPGIKDYLHTDRVADIQKAIEKYIQPWANCKDPTLIVRRHAYRGVTYLWLVNIHSQEEYEYVRERIGAGVRPADPEKAKKEAIQYLADRAVGKRFTAEVTIPGGTFVAYDVLKGQAIPLKPSGNRVSFTADMERLGGTLIALYPEPIKRVTATVAVSAAKNESLFLRWFHFGGARIARGQSATLSVTVNGPSGKPLAGTQPLKVEVITPKGEWVELTGAHATDDGVWSATIHPAINDPAGTWKIRVKELSSGMAGETSFRVN